MYQMPATAAKVEETVTVDAAAKEAQVSELIGSLGSFNPDTDKADDLQKIKGVGPQMEQVLNQIGIYTFASSE